MSFGSLGFVDSGRKYPIRDPFFVGASPNPSRKDLPNIGKRAPPVPPRPTIGADSDPTVRLSETQMLQRKVQFLEAQDKRKSAEMAELRKTLVVSDVWVRAVTQRDTPSKTGSVPVQEATDANDVPVGTEVNLLYPMHTVDGKTWMRRRAVCPNTATMRWEWLLLYDEAGETVFVSDFH